jgi:excinuclease UvrABC ATPase subunit
LQDPKKKFLKKFVYEASNGKKVIILYSAIKQQKGAHHEVITKAESLGFHIPLELMENFIQLKIHLKLIKNATQ